MNLTVSLLGQGHYIAFLVVSCSANLINSDRKVILESWIAGIFKCNSHQKDVLQVSSANYQARAFGIRADMCIGEAKRLCPELVVMPYQYDKYQVASEQASNISP